MRPVSCHPHPRRCGVVGFVPTKRADLCLNGRPRDGDWVWPVSPTAEAVAYLLPTVHPGQMCQPIGCRCQVRADGFKLRPAETLIGSVQEPSRRSLKRCGTCRWGFRKSGGDPARRERVCHLQTGPKWGPYPLRWQSVDCSNRCRSTAPYRLSSNPEIVHPGRIQCRHCLPSPLETVEKPDVCETLTGKDQLPLTKVIVIDFVVTHELVGKQGMKMAEGHPAPMSETCRWRFYGDDPIHLPGI